MAGAYGIGKELLKGRGYEVRAGRRYRIEHRTGSQWTAVAAFSVKLPSCKPE